MVAYELYCLDPAGGYKIIGVLPEGRKNPERITQWPSRAYGRVMYNRRRELKCGHL
jgi:hypothetical protein